MKKLVVMNSSSYNNGKMAKYLEAIALRYLEDTKHRILVSEEESLDESSLIVSTSLHRHREVKPSGTQWSCQAKEKILFGVDGVARILKDAPPTENWNPQEETEICRKIPLRLLINTNIFMP